MEKEREKETPICKKGIQIKNCKRCLFEVLCEYEKMIKKNNVWRGGSFEPGEI